MQFRGNLCQRFRLLAGRRGWLPVPASHGKGDDEEWGSVSGGRENGLS